MLLKIELENFFSIKDRVTLDFRAGNINTAKSRELKDNVIDWNGQKVLKTIGLFGQNASGKSNIVKAINFCCRMVFESHLYNENTVFGFQPFKFDGWSSKPSSFLVDFVCDGIEYEYSFSLTKSEIISESLFYYPNKRRAKIFVRQIDGYSYGEGVIPRAKDVELNTSRKNLYLSRASSMNREFAKTIFNYFYNSFILGIVPINSEITEQLFTKYKKVILEALSVCDCDICNIELRKNKDVIQFLTYHKTAPEIPFDMAGEESAGTSMLFCVLLLLLDVVKNKKSLMLDEFDISLHTLLADFILDFIHASESSQLLFTTHNTNLIDTDRLRKDQIVFVNKKSDGSTDVYSLYDFKDFRDNMDAEKSYKQGRFDAVPIVGTSVGSLKKLLEEIK
ncbi:MAG: ATP-binding protein [Bacteroidales bacterium]|nr:ATP-binding protein [Bacteroidales bacterium]